MPNTAPREFWDHKITGWEAGRYERQPGQGIMELFANRASNSIRFRLDKGLELIRPHCKGARVVEFGCGTGRLTSALLDAGAAHYTGVDIAPSAIEVARKNAEAAGITDRAEFHIGGIDVLGKVIEADIVFSLGLADWLEDDVIQELLQLSPGAKILHSFSERRSDFSQWIHRMYVYFAYGHRTKAYVPRYHTEAEILNLVSEGRRPNSRVLRYPKMSFGVFLTDLPE
jgi:SAM-dependent methyltransferase